MVEVEYVSNFVDLTLVDSLCVFGDRRVEEEEEEKVALVFTMVEVGMEFDSEGEMELSREVLLTEDVAPDMEVEGRKEKACGGEGECLLLVVCSEVAGSMEEALRLDRRIPLHVNDDENMVSICSRGSRSRGEDNKWYDHE